MKIRRFLAPPLCAAMLLCACGAPASSADPIAKGQLSAAQQAGEEAQVTPTGAGLPGLLGEVPTLHDTSLVPNVPTFTVEPDFSNVLHAEQTEYWSGEARAKLLQNGFAVASDDGWNEFYQIYESNRYEYTPNYVTTDAMLHSYHLYFQYLQRGIEERELVPRLKDLTTRMLQAAEGQLQTLAGTAWENAARRNVAYFAVAASLLDPAVTPPQAVADLVAQELNYIGQAGGINLSPVLCTGSESEVLEDYSQYIPRSYYAGNETLERYFKAMMWYGRLPFLASDEDLTRSALLMNLALQQDSDAWAQWEGIYRVTSFFAGASDDATCAEYTALMTGAYGGVPEVQTLPKEEKAFRAFCESLQTLRTGAINATPIFDDEDREKATAGMRFMGQRYSMDASVMQRLIYREVEPKADGTTRSLPDALDVPAALGSDTALDLLHTRRDTDYPNYDSQMQAVREVLNAAPDSMWTASLSAAWLDALRPLTEAHGAGWPQFMQTEAWRARSLSTFLGSWTELKHDTALYTKQVYAEMGGGGVEAQDDRGWVETEPAVFGRLAALTDATANGLDELGLLGDTDAENLRRMAELNRSLMTIAEKELRGELPTDEEFDLIRSFGGQLEHFWIEAVQDEEKGVHTPMEAPAELVTDVATDPESGNVLELGTSVGTIYVIVNVDGSPRLASGTVYNFYQFEQPLNERMTDGAWQDLLDEREQDAVGRWVKKIQPVDWTDSYNLATTYQGVL